MTEERVQKEDGAQKTAGHEARRSVNREVRVLRLGELDVRSLFAASTTIVLDLEGDLVAFVESRYAGTLESRGVYEHVLAAVFWLDKAEAARMIEELHCAIDTSHGGNSF